MVLSNCVHTLNHRILTPINTIHQIVASSNFRKNVIPQPYVDSQEISHFSTGFGSNTKTPTIIKRKISVSLDSREEN